jgi:hypothetical protein
MNVRAEGEPLVAWSWVAPGRGLPVMFLCSAESGRFFVL